MPKNKFRWFADAKQRLMAKVEIVTESGCWIFMGRTDKNGYGRMWGDNQKERQAHILAYEIFIGPIPEGLELDHLCRVRCCVNPRHLEAVTHGENLRRGGEAIGGAMACTQARASQMKAKTHCRSGHEYTLENTKTYRGKRKCRECSRIHKRESYHAKKNGSIQPQPNGATP